MEPLRLELCADADCVGEVRAAARAYAERNGASDQIAADVALAVSEAVTNVVIHAYGGRPGGMRLVAERREQGIVISIEDDGHGLVPNPETQGLGLGLPLIAKVTSDFAIESGPERTGTRVLMTFVVEPGEHPRHLL